LAFIKTWALTENLGWLLVFRTLRVPKRGVDLVGDGIKLLFGYVGPELVPVSMGDLSTANLEP
jgi:hypothetical protein